MSATRGFWIGLGQAVVILALALGYDFCNRYDKSQTAGQWFSCSSQQAAAEKE